MKRPFQSLGKKSIRFTASLFLVLLSLAYPGMAQQQITPDDFNPKQADLFKKVTEAVSTPCCQNGIPVAYHASGMAQQVRDMVILDIRAGKSEREIMDALAALKMGPDQDMPLIFTVPDRNLLGDFFWVIGGVILFVLLLGVYFMLKRSRGDYQQKGDDAALIDQYRDYIKKQVEETA